MKKKFFAVATFALAFAFAFSASAAYDLGSTTLKRGSKGAAVSQLQMALNACNAAGLSTDGNFGRGTEAAVKAFQASKGLKADGLVGNGTKGALNSCGSTTPTTPSSALCPNGMTLASNCTAAPSSSNWGTSSAEGYLADGSSDSSNRVSTVYESESDKVVAGFRATARLADQKIEKVTVKFRNTDTDSGSSANLSRYISSVSLWNGSTKIATMSVNDADRSNSDDTYTFNFTGLNAITAKDSVGRIYVSVNANGGLDSNDTQYSKWYVAIAEVRATSPNGVYNNYASGSLNLPVAIGANTLDAGGLTFGKFAANGVKAEVSLSANNPSSQTIVVSETANTNDKTLLKFKITAKNSNLTLRKIPVKLSLSNNASSATLSDVINSVKLYRDATQLDNKDGGSHTAGVYSFDNLSGASIASGSSAEFTVVVDLKKQVGNYASGTTLTAEFTSAVDSNFSVQDTNGDQLQVNSTYRSGSAIGQAATLRTKGVAGVAGAATAPVSSIGNSTTQQVTFSFPLSLVGTGVDYYVPKTAYLVTSTTLPSAVASQGIYFAIQNTSDNSFVSSAASFVDSSATVYGTSPQQLLATNSGVGATLKATINGDGTPAYYKLYVLGFAGAETLNGSLTSYAVDNQSAFTVVSAGAVQ